MSSDAIPEPVPDAVLDDLRARVRATRRAVLPPGRGWSRGTDEEALGALLEHWEQRFDWRAHEAAVRAWPWVAGGDPVRLRAVHQRAGGGAGGGAPAVVLLHGWPDSVLRFARVLPLLTDVDVVVPALPGYPFALPVEGGGRSTTQMADAVAALLRELGLSRCVVSGGDIGSSVAEALAVRHPDLVGALHLTDVPMAHLRTIGDEQLAQLPQGAQRTVRDARAWQAAEGAYNHEQSTKPHTLAAALADSPAGLAAWVVEKLRSWSDCDGDLARTFSADDALAWVSAYWVSGCIGTSFSPYVEPRDTYDRVDVPAAFTLFPRDLVPPTREAAEVVFDVRVWQEAGRGGHFAAWEQPEAFAAGVRTALGLLAR